MDPDVETMVVLLESIANQQVLQSLLLLVITVTVVLCGVLFCVKH